jgi:hypothetical protein
MSKSKDRVPCAEADQLARAIESLRESGIKFRGPYASSRGQLIAIEDTILTVYEVLELFSRGQLNRDGIRNLLKEFTA